jgi:hypothetical protein
MKTTTLSLLLISLFAARASADMVFFEQNSGLPPASTTYGAAVLEEGFAFTPTSTIDLSGFRTKFFSTDGRTVSFELFQSVLGVPNTAAPLVNESFTAMAGTLSGVDFSPITLVGGTEYFAAITNLANLGATFADMTGAIEVPTGEIRVTFSGDGTRFGNTVGDAPFTQQIFQFITPTPAAVPEPSTTVLLALCGVVGGGLSWRRRRAGCAGNV